MLNRAATIVASVPNRCNWLAVRQGTGENVGMEPLTEKCPACKGTKYTPADPPAKGNPIEIMTHRECERCQGEGVVLTEAGFEVGKLIQRSGHAKWFPMQMQEFRQHYPKAKQ